VVGSALVDRVAAGAGQGKTGAALIEPAAALIGEIRRAVDAL
jgi:hypothetical protein